MRKYLKIIAIFIISLSAIYSGFWLFNKNRIKVFAESLVQNAIKRIGGEDSEFYYSQTLVTGFPFSYKVTISNPQFAFRDVGIFFDVASQGDLVLSSDVAATNFYIKLPKLFYIKNRYAEEGKEPVVVNYSSAPELKIKSFPQNTKLFATNIIKGSFDLIPIGIEKLSYRDSGFSIYNSGVNSAIIASSHGMAVNFDNNLESDGNSVLAEASIKDLDIDSIISKMYGGRGVGRINLSTNMHFTEGEDYKYSLDLSKFTLGSDLFNISADAQIKKKPDVSLPQGGVNIKISNYAELVDFQVGIMNFLVGNYSMPIGEIKSDQVERIKGFLFEIAAEKTNNNKDILITVVRKQDEEAQVGGVSLGEVIGIFKRSFEENPS